MPATSDTTDVPRSASLLPPLSELVANADRLQGKVQFMQCSACHSLEEGGTTQPGPTLHGLFGRRAGRLPGYAFSPALQAATFIWTPETLDRWLADPVGFLPDTRMRFLAIVSANDRAHLIAYLMERTAAAPINADRTPER